jgi:hypothetical protein
MDDRTMLQVASVLLVMTAAGGVIMALQRMLQKHNPSSWIAMAHGFLAASAFTLLVYAAFTTEVGSRAIFGTLILALAAAGGVIMNLVYHLADKLIPQWLLHLHIALAAIGTALVVWGAWG